MLDTILSYVVKIVRSNKCQSNKNDNFSTEGTKPQPIVMMKVNEKKAYEFIRNGES